jgi:erythritol transport system ATP-binding protein
MIVSTDTVVMRAEGIKKLYPGTAALKGVDFNVYNGKVNVLVGENGAGKSTLMKILAGVEQPSSGSISLNGKQIRYASPRDALALGIGIIYQELNLFPNMSVAENIFANREHMKRPGWIDQAYEEKKAAELMQRLQQDIDPKTLVRDLKVGQQQIVEIARALVEDASILIMDEPTSALSQAEAEVLFRIIAELKANGVSIVYISHRMEELISIGDYITVLRDGRLIAERPMEGVDLGWIVRTMIGEDTEKIFHAEKHAIGDTILEVRNLRLPSSTEKMTLDGVSFQLKKGEILGLYGLMGAGRTETLETIMGLHKEATGEVILGAQSLDKAEIRERIRRGISLVPEDRQRQGLVPTMSIANNMTLAGLWRIVTRGVHIGRKDEDTKVREMIGKMSIKIASAGNLITSLSGGNQQKVVIGKSLITVPKVLMLDEPTRGIDVGAKGEVFDIVNALAAEGIAILFVSSELKEVRAISDRVIVMSRGRISGEFSREAATEEALLAALSGPAETRESRAIQQGA